MYGGRRDHHHRSGCFIPPYAGGFVFFAVSMYEIQGTIKGRDRKEAVESVLVFFFNGACRFLFVSCFLSVL